MEKKQRVQIILLTLFLIISIIFIGIMAFFMYKLYNDNLSLNASVKDLDNKLSNSNNSVFEDNTSNKSEEKDQSEVLNIDSLFVRKLYNYVAKYNYYEELVPYQSKKITEKELTNRLKLLTIFNNLEKNYATRVEYIYENEYEPRREHIIYSENIIEEQAAEIFGKDVKIKHEDANPYDGHSIIYKNNEYDSFDYNGGGGTLWSNCNVLISAEKDKDGTIYLYDKYIHLVELDDSEYKREDGSWGNAYDIFSSSDRSEKLASKIDFMKDSIKNQIYDGLDNIKLGTIQYDKKYLENIEKYLGKDLPTFKHTYKQNSDGTYYWYSTEPVK